MTDAVWLLMYDIADADAGEYLEWFHGEHVPDKLSRPGYEWAAHYRGPARRDGAAHGYLALFGARSTRTFLDPSPAQHRARQDERTRSMMAHRVGTLAGVFTREWSDGADLPGAAAAPAIRVALVDAGDADEALGAWCVQTWLPALHASAVALGAHKWVNVAGTPRHLLLTGHASAAAAQRDTPAVRDGGGVVATAMNGATVAHGQCIWPRSGDA